jgi:hypothetical protein
MTDYGDLHYPHLAPIKLTLVGSGGSSRSPVRLPAGCVETAIAPPPVDASHDFSLGPLPTAARAGVGHFFVSL